MLKRCGTWVLALAAAAMISAAAAAAVAPKAGPHSLTEIVDAVVLHGPTGELPAHLSAVLGVGQPERPTPVKQAVLRQGELVRTFNVCSARREDVVVINYNERSHLSLVYLFSPAGRLRKALRYQAGEAPNERLLADARADAAAEIVFWTAWKRAAQARR